MSLKSIDMQIAVNRTPEASHVQRDILQKPPFEQMQLAVQQEKQMVRNRKMSEKLEKSSRSAIKDDGNPSKKGKQRGKAAGVSDPSASSESDARLSEHPYKGKHIDLTL
ncbi:hypothetical protein [Gorillibacterium massiliense]|uniref:hypothetical protein n=1 Tax=Gorillibacterium massiliense TaxID=1280390 RepID=UPI0004B1522E|nr:hypothetical protein [Gorillibacterium massiliense]